MIDGQRSVFRWMQRKNPLQDRSAARARRAALTALGAALLVTAAGLAAHAQTERSGSAGSSRPASVSSFLKQRLEAVGKAFRGGLRIGRGSADAQDAAETNSESGPAAQAAAPTRPSPRLGIVRSLPSANASAEATSRPEEAAPTPLTAEPRWEEARITDSGAELPSLERALLKQQHLSPPAPAGTPELAAQVPPAEFRVTSFDPQTTAEGVRRVRVLPAEEAAAQGPADHAPAPPTEAIAPQATAAAPPELPDDQTPPESLLTGQAATPRSATAGPAPAIDTRAALLEFLGQAATAEAPPAEPSAPTSAPTEGQPRPADPPAGALLAPVFDAQPEPPAETP
jgi:hypothetical protein